MNKKILLPKYRYDGSQNEDLYIPIKLEEENNLLKNNDRTIDINLSQKFYEEKNSCVQYKIFGKIRMIFRNLYSGNTNYIFLKDKLSLLPNQTDEYKGYLPYDEYGFFRKDFFHEVKTGDTITDLSLFTGFTLSTTGVNPHNIITSLDSSKYNWNFFISYVYDEDENFPITYTLSGGTSFSYKSGDGIIFRLLENDSYYILSSPVKHGMNQGEYIIFSTGNTINSFFNKPYYINSVGNETFRSELYTVYLSKSQFNNVGTLSSGSMVIGKRCTDNKNINNSTSRYYVQKHKTLTNVNDYIVDNVGFESPIFEEERKVIFENFSGDNDIIVDRNRMESIIYSFNDPIVVSGLTNNLGYTPSEVFLTTIFKNGNGYFSYPPKVGYSFNFHNSWIDTHFNGSVSKEVSIETNTPFYDDGYTFTPGKSITEGTVLNGSFVEYIPNEMKERVVSETFHKITINPSFFDHGQTDSNIYYGSSLSNPNGLYYQTHYKIKLRELSSYVETSNTNNVLNLPDNAKYFPDENMWKWRDVYDLGYKDEYGNGVDFSYMNDMLYIHKDINFCLRNEIKYNNKQDGITSFKNISSVKC